MTLKGKLTGLVMVLFGTLASAMQLRSFVTTLRISSGSIGSQRRHRDEHPESREPEA